MLVGQRKLRERLIDRLNAFSLPNTIILVGPKGQGKKTIAKWLADQMEAPIYIPPDLKIDSIRELNNDSRTISSPKLYLLADAEDMTVQAQNALLKLAEEPPENAYIILTVQDKSALLPTILSRSVEFRMDGYTLQELERFTDDPELLELCTNPGGIQQLEEFDYENLLQHARKVVANIAGVSASNSFNIMRYVDKEKHEIFLSMLIHAYGEHMADGHVCDQQLRVVYETKTLLERHKSINRVNALEMMFIKLRGAARSEIQRTEE